MRILSQMSAAVALLLLAACSGGGAPAPASGAGPDATAPTTPLGFRLSVTGATGVVLEDGAAGQVVLLRRGADQPQEVAFENGAWTVHDVPPGRYSLAGIGPLACRGLDFEVGPTSPRALGTLRAEIVETDYYVALMSGRKATGAELADLAGETGIPPAGIDARPLGILESAPCFLSKDGPGQTWRDRPLGEQILIGIGFAAFCALAVSQGGLCSF